MNTRELVIAGLLFTALQIPVQAAEYEIDPSHSFVEFRIQHLGYSWLYGRFNTITGSFSHDPNAPQDNKISVEIDTASVDTNHAKRDKHLRNEDFLDVNKFPKATFESTKYIGSAEEGVLHGMLTLHGISKPIEIKLRKLGEGKDPWGGYRAGFVGTVKLVRRDFGMTYQLGPKSEDMELELGIEGIRRK
jgi:polyisoprenoid-binding protein YceI